MFLQDHGQLQVLTVKKESPKIFTLSSYVVVTGSINALHDSLTYV